MILPFHTFFIVFIAISSISQIADGFLETRIGRTCPNLSHQSPSISFLSALELSSENEVITESNVHLLGDRLESLCSEGKVSEAADLLRNAEISLAEKGQESWLEEKCYVTILKSFSRLSKSQSTGMAEDLFKRMTQNSENGIGPPPTALSYNSLISVWASSNQPQKADRCYEYLDSLWALYDETNDSKYVPLRSSYISTIDALARSRQGYDGAKRAEALLEDMESSRHDHPQLSPNKICFNAVLNAWSKSGVARGAATRCEDILKRMLSLYETGRDELAPDTTSFNTAIHTLAKSKERKSESRAEALLELMNELCSRDDSVLAVGCKPDQVVSFC